MNLMTRGNQTRHQLLADRPRRTCHENLHHWPLNRGIIYTPYDKTAAPEVTPPSPLHGNRPLVSTLPSPAKARTSPQRGTSRSIAAVARECLDMLRSRTARGDAAAGGR